MRASLHGRMSQPKTFGHGYVLLPLQLVYGQYRETQVSIKENKAEYTTPGKV